MGPGVLNRIAEATGTPVYVYDAAAIRGRYEAFRAALGTLPHRIHYAVKANGNLAVLRVLREAGAGADIVSAGELARVRVAGFAADHIVFSGVGKTPADLASALEGGVGLINVESREEAERLARLSRDRARRTAVGVRVNPDVTVETHPYTQTAGRGIKFGVPLDEAEAVAADIAATDGLVLKSLGVHIGSQISDPAPFAQAAAVLVELVRAVQARGVTTLESLDVGGGLAVQYGDDQPALAPERFVEAVAPVVRATGLTLLVEPGRSLVAEAGVLLTRVVYRKHSGGRELAVVDAGMNDLLRPSLYGAEHRIEVVPPADTGGGGPEETMDVVGPLCESGDFLGRDRRLRGARTGALLAVHTAGAYGFSMSSNYNARRRAAEVLVDGERWGLVRDRETVDDLMRGERTEPRWEE